MSNPSQPNAIYWLNDNARTFLERGYLKSGVTPEARMREIAEAAQAILKIDGFADRFESYLHKGWYSLSSPIWSNFGAGRGLPISCNGSFVPDSMSGILEKVAEIGMMTKNGAGTSVYLGDLRARGTSISAGGSSSGPVHFAELFETVTNVVSQSNVRRGSCAAYLPVEHPDILEFLQIRGEGHAIQHLSIGVTITDQWMTDMIAGDKHKRAIWAKIIEKRSASGYPYIFFTDAANRGAPQVYRDKGLKISASNLCTEIFLYSSPDESFVCNLSSMNLLHYDEWKGTDAVETLTFFLDAVMTDYINKTKDIPYMRAAYRFAINQRALGIGVLGWHSLLQSKLIPFESMEAKYLNSQIHRLIRDKSAAASREMAILYGEPSLLAAAPRAGFLGLYDKVAAVFGVKRPGYGLRNVTTMAIAPTTSSSFILGQVSPGIEPENSNYYVKKLAKGSFSHRNPYLAKLLVARARDDDETWNSILVRGGSVQHLDFLTQHEKDVFKTFGEISQKEIVIQAAMRQKFIDQGQSLNLMIGAEVPPKEVSQLYIEAWKLGLKSLYYARSGNPAQQLARSILTCTSCES